MTIRLLHKVRKKGKHTRHIWLSSCTVDDDHLDEERNVNADCDTHVRLNKEHETLTQACQWPAIVAREHPQIHTTFCFPALSAGRIGIIVRDKLAIL
jgi:hypothetical protein